MSARLRRSRSKDFGGIRTRNHGRRKTCSSAERIGKSCARPYCRKPVTPTTMKGGEPSLREYGDTAAVTRFLLRGESSSAIRDLVRNKRRCERLRRVIRRNRRNGRCE